MIDNDTSNFLHDFGLWVFDRGKKAGKRCNDQKRDGLEWQSECGRAQGYYEVLTHLMNQLEVFGISTEAIGLSTIDPDELI